MIEWWRTGGVIASCAWFLVALSRLLLAGVLLMVAAYVLRRQMRVAAQK